MTAEERSQLRKVVATMRYEGRHVANKNRLRAKVRGEGFQQGAAWCADLLELFIDNVAKEGA